MDKREGDAGEFDPRRVRQWKPVDPDEFGLTYRNVGLIARGSIVVSVILIVALGGFMVYLDIGSRREHRLLQKTVATLACQNLYDFAERKALRLALERDPKNIRYWCPDISLGTHE